MQNQEIATSQFSMTEDERNFATSYLKETGDFFLNTARKLTPSEWSFKPEEGVWSPGECALHIGITESSFLKDIQSFLQIPATPEKLETVLGKEEMLMKSMTDRSYRVKGAPIEVLPGQSLSQNELLDEFEKNRNEVIAFLKTCDAPLKAHYIVFPVYGDINIYQYILFISAHTIRHTLQMQEVQELMKKG